MHVRAQIWVIGCQGSQKLLTRVRPGGSEVIALRQRLRDFHQFFVRNRRVFRLEQRIDRLHHEQQGFECILRWLLRKPTGDLRFYLPSKGVYLRCGQRNHGDGCSRWETFRHFWRNLIAECTPSSSLLDRETLLSSVPIVLFAHDHSSRLTNVSPRGSRSRWTKTNVKAGARERTGFQIALDDLNVGIRPKS